MSPLTPFQWIALPVLGLVLLVELVRWLRAPSLWSQRVVRMFIWFAAAITIADPDLTQNLATAVGITRGADLVFYLFVLLFVAVSFYFYARHVRTQRLLTELIRHLAIQEARRGTDGATPASGPAGDHPAGGGDLPGSLRNG